MSATAAASSSRDSPARRVSPGRGSPGRTRSPSNRGQSPQSSDNRSTPHYDTTATIDPYDQKHLLNPLEFFPSSKKILIVGDGDLSFSVSLNRICKVNSNLVATVYDSREVILGKYAGVNQRIEELEGLGVRVLFGIDVTKLALEDVAEHGYSGYSAESGPTTIDLGDAPCESLMDRIMFDAVDEGSQPPSSSSSASSASSPASSTLSSYSTHLILPNGKRKVKFDRMIFQFPLIPPMNKEQFERATFKDPCLENRFLLLRFIWAAEKMLERPDGIAMITSKDVKPYNEWRLENTLVPYCNNKLVQNFWREENEENEENAKSSSSSSTNLTPLSDSDLMHFFGKIRFSITTFPGYNCQNVSRDSEVKDTEAISYMYGFGGNSSRYSGTAVSNSSRYSGASDSKPSINPSCDSKPSNPSGDSKPSNFQQCITSDSNSVPLPSLLEASTRWSNYLKTFACHVCNTGIFKSQKDKDNHFKSKTHERFCRREPKWEATLETWVKGELDNDKAMKEENERRWARGERLKGEKTLKSAKDAKESAKDAKVAEKNQKVGKGLKAAEVNDKSPVRKRKSEIHDEGEDGREEGQKRPKVEEQTDS